ncbi:hypothetical protein CaCOL14_004557 [Colletotrichum acutatum]
MREIANCQERNQETINLRSHKKEGGIAEDAGKDGAANTKDECRAGEIEDGRASGGEGKGRAKKGKKKVGSPSTSGDIFKCLFQKDVLYLAILELPS